MGPTIDQIKMEWSFFSDHYVQHDSAAQSFYFTLISMMDIPSAKHILEVGCGRCLLVPHVIDLKHPNSTYLATDLSSKMIQFARERLKLVLEKS